MSRSEIFCSVDIETNGPCAGIHSMLSIGVYSFDIYGKEHGTFYKTLYPIEDFIEDPDTMKWWSTQTEAWNEVIKNRTHPASAMYMLDDYLNSLPGKPIFVGYPLGFDFPFVIYYLTKYVGMCRFGFSGIDMKSYAMAALSKTKFSTTTKKTFPNHWIPKAKHTHIALDDAIEQGKLFYNMYTEVTEYKTGPII